MYYKQDARDFYLTLLDIDSFLVSLGYISGEESAAEWLGDQSVDYYWE